MPTIATQIQRLLKKTDRMKQQAVKSLLRTLKHIDQERKQRTADLEEAAKLIGKQLLELGHIGSNSKAVATQAKRTATTGKKERVRRTPEQLKTEAVKVVALIRSSGKDGISGADIRKNIPNVGQNIKGFVRQYTGEKLKTTGQKVKMRYHHAG